jgi:hypothetical protein
MASTYANDSLGREGRADWFSERPIPELTRPSTDDPTLPGTENAPPGTK